MRDSPTKRETKGLTQEAFDLLLSKLDADPEVAGEKYLLLYLRLTTFFQTRRCPAAEDLTDETLNRVAQKIAAGEEPRNLTAFCYGFARLIWLEYLKKPENKRVDFDELPPMNFPVEEKIDLKKQLALFEKCLRKLPTAEARLLIEYWYHDELSNRDARKEMAERLNLSPTALRIKIHRIKGKIEGCLSKISNKK